VLNIPVDVNDFFPYKSYREEQKEVIDRIYLGLSTHKNIIFAAPNGTGKTVDNLVAALPFLYQNDEPMKIIYLCRTHTQNARVIKEIQKINEKLGEPGTNKKHLKLISAVSLRGRKEMCSNRTVRKIKGTSPTDLMGICSTLRKNRNCKPFTNMIKNKSQMEADLTQISKTGIDAQDLIEFCKRKENTYCPYFSTKFLMKSADVIVCNYQWIFNPNICKTFLEGMGIELDNCIIIIDECHNLADVASEIDSERLTNYTINQTLKDLEYGRATKEMIKNVKIWQKILEILNKSIKIDDVVLSPQSIINNYLKMSGLGTIINLKNYINDLDEYGEAIFVDKSSSGLNPINFIEVLVKFMQKFLDTKDDKRYIFLGTPISGKLPRIEILCMDPRDTVSTVYSKTKGTISCSGTLNEDSFISILGLNETGKDYVFVEIKSPFKKRNIKILIVDKINTKGANRTSSMYKRLCTKIAEVLFNTPANVGLFCASYVVLKGLLENGIESITKFSRKKIFIERSQNSASDNAILIEDYKNEASKGGAVLLGVLGGRNSEGEDFPGDYMNAVVIVGMPFSRPTSRVKGKIDYYNTIFKGKGRLFAYIWPAIKRSMQASGRPIRRLEDKGAIILLDDRFKYYKDLISPWIKDNTEYIPDEPNLIANHLQLFFKN
jgi:DNA excision repair protein ERCC-2